MAEPITLQLPERLYQHLVNTAQATNRPLEAVILRTLEVGSPPDWHDVPDEFQADLADLDRLDDNMLWQLAHSRKSLNEMARYDELLECNRKHLLTDAERLELISLRKEADRYMLCKAQAAALLRRRGHQVPTL